MYRVANKSQYLAITGKGIGDIKIAKKSWVFPWQLCTILDVSQVNYTFNVQAMSAEKLPFVLPAVFTIGPNTDELECLLKYARLLSSHDQHSNHVNDLVQGIIDGETRVLAASMTMEQIFTKEFNKQVFDHVQLELNQFGLLIYNAGVKHNVPGHEYFLGEIGSKTREVETPHNEAKYDAETKVKVKSEVKIFENEREEANSKLATKKASCIKYAQVNTLTRTEKLKA